MLFLIHIYCFWPVCLKSFCMVFFGALANFCMILLQVFGFGLHDRFAGVWDFCMISFAGVLFCPPWSFCRYLELVSGIFYRCLDFLHDILLQVFGMGEAACHLPKLWRARPNFCTEWKLKVIRRSLSKHNCCLDQKTNFFFLPLRCQLGSMTQCRSFSRRTIVPQAKVKAPRTRASPSPSDPSPFSSRPSASTSPCSRTSPPSRTHLRSPSSSLTPSQSNSSTTCPSISRTWKQQKERQATCTRTWRIGKSVFFFSAKNLPASF